MKTWHRLFQLSFLASTASLILALKVIESRHGHEVLAAVRPGRVRELIEPSVNDARDAKRRRLFWATRASGRDGLAIRLFEDDRLFESIFPGYAAARQDKALWETYFSQTFDGSIVSPLIEEASAGGLISTSWLGSLEVFRRYGADVLVFGNSETFRALQPSRLSKIAGGGRVLLIGKSSLTPDIAGATAKALAPSGHKAKVAIWGYSLWGAYFDAERPARSRTELSRLEGFLGASAEDEKASSSGNSWTGLISQRFDTYKPPAALTDSPVIGVIDGFPARQGPSDRGEFLFPGSALGHEDVLSRMAALATPGYHRLEGVTSKDCDMSRASAEAAVALEAMSKVSERTIVYLTPTTPLQTRQLPACFLPAVVGMLRSKVGPRVTVETGDWNSYDLGLLDFVKPAAQPGWLRIDVNHANYEGSLKVTRKVGRLMAAALEQSYNEVR